MNQQFLFYFSILQECLQGLFTIVFNQWSKQNPVNQSLSLLLLLWLIAWSCDRSINQSINQSIDRSLNQSINWLLSTSVHRSINHSITHLINQSIYQSIINKSIFQTNFKNPRIFRPCSTGWVLQQLTLTKPNQGHYIIIRLEELQVIKTYYVSKLRFSSYVSFFSLHFYITLLHACFLFPYLRILQQQHQHKAVSGFQNPARQVTTVIFWSYIKE